MATQVMPAAWASSISVSILSPAVCCMTRRPASRSTQVGAFSIAIAIAIKAGCVAFISSTTTTVSAAGSVAVAAPGSRRAGVSLSVAPSVRRGNA